LPPWINTNSNNQAGLVGVNNLSYNFNIDSTCALVFSTANKFISNIALGATSTAMTTPDPTSAITVDINGTDYTGYTTTTIAGTSISAFQGSQLLFNFLSLQPEQYKKIS